MVCDRIQYDYDDYNSNNKNNIKTYIHRLYIRKERKRSGLLQIEVPYTAEIIRNCRISEHKI
jgi:hypothetical protein